MKTCISSVWRLILCSIETLGLSICGPLASANLASLVPIVPQPDCARDLSIRVTSNPAHILYGQTSVVSWSVHGPSACLQTSVELNGEAVSPQGSQIVMPSQSTTYRIRVSYQWNGVPGQKEEAVRVTVSDPLIAPVCPALVVPQTAEFWEPDPQMDKKQGGLPGLWLTEIFNVSHTTLLPGPEMVWDLGRVSDEDAPLNDPGLTYLGACIFLPETVVPPVDSLIPEGSDPAAGSSGIY